MLFSLKTPTKRRKSKLRDLDTDAFRIEDLSIQPFSSRHYREVPSAFPLHTSVHTALCMKGFPSPQPQPSPTRASRPGSGNTFSPNFAFTHLLKIWSAFSSVFPRQAATFPFSALIFSHRCVCVCVYRFSTGLKTPWEQKSHIMHLSTASGRLHCKCLIYEMCWV